MNLSKFEHEVMTIVWNTGKCSAPQVHEMVSAKRKSSYSTVKTIIDRLEAKGAIERVDTQGRTIFFRAAVDPESVQPRLIDQMLNILFAGDRRPLLNQIVQSERLSRDDLEYLEAIVKARKKDLGE